MIKLNRYLRELGIDENYWLFSNQEDGRYREDEEGFKPAEFFELDTSFSLYIYSHLCYFRDNCLYGHPGSMTFEEWKKTLDQMIEGFKLLIKEDDNYPWDRTDSKRRQRKINRGLRLFAKYYQHLWY